MCYAFHFITVTISLGVLFLVCFYLKMPILPSFFQDSLDTGLTGLPHFLPLHTFFSILKMLLHCLPVAIVSDGKSEVIGIVASLCVMCHFSLAVFKTVSLSLVSSLTMISLSVVIYAFIFLELCQNS